MTPLSEIWAMAPLLIVATTALLLVVLSAWRSTAAAGGLAASLAAIGALLALAASVTPLVLGIDLPATLFSGALNADSFSQITQSGLLLAVAAGLWAMRGMIEAHHIARPEWSALVLIATLGMMVTVAANDFIVLYVGLELQALCLYILAALRRDDPRSVEAGLKYVVLGGLASGIFLFGLSLVYGASGQLSYDAMASAFTPGGKPAPLMMAGLVLLLAGLMFKLAAAPFHMWAPDVYQGAPTPSVVIFAAAPKLAAIAVLVRVVWDPLAEWSEVWQPVIVVVATVSMAIGALAALAQQDLKRLLAYSAIGHAGYALLGLAAAQREGAGAALAYVIFYLPAAIVALSVLAALRQDGQPVQTLSALTGLSRRHPGAALTMTAALLSLAGVPPLAGFFGKFFIFVPLIQAGMAPLAIFGAVTSVVAAAYYLRVVHAIYDDPERARPIRMHAVGPGEFLPSFGLRAVTLVAGLALLAGPFVAGPVMSLADAALAPLFSTAPPS